MRWVVQFICPNPKCGKLIQVGDDKVGQQITCPTCRWTVIVPGAAQEGQTKTDRATLEAYQQFLRGLKEHQPPPEQAESTPTAPPKPPSGAAADGMDDLSQLPGAEGVSHAYAPAPAAVPLAPKAGWTPSLWRRPVPLTGSYARHCLQAMRHSGADAGSVLVASFFLAVLETYRCCLLGPEPMLPAEMGIPRGLLIAVVVVLAVVLGGYCLSVCLTLISAAAVGGGRRETWQRPTSGGVLRTGVLGVSVAMIYVLPVVTLPLLPLALLTLSLTGDGRAFNLRWQLRSAFRYGEGFAILWLFLLVGIAVVVVGWWAVSRLACGLAGSVAEMLSKPEGLAMRVVIDFFGALLGGVLFFPLVCGLARCIGLLVRFRPAVTDSLPVGCPPAVTWGVVVACLAVAAVLTYALS